MKKILLTLAAVAVTAGAWAQQEDYESLVDITPTYYKFNAKNPCDIKDLTSLATKDIKLGQFNINNSGITKNLNDGENYFTNESLAKGNLLFGGWVYGQSKHDNLKEGLSIQNLGEEIGNVFVVNGSSSKLEEVVNESLGLNTEISKVDGDLSNNLIFFWILNHLPIKKANAKDEDEGTSNGYSSIRIRIELNAFVNELPEEEDNALSEIIYMHEQAVAFGEVKAIENKDFRNEDGSWNPYRWLVIEEDIKPGDINLGSYLKMDLTTNMENFNSGALLIRNIEIFAIPKNHSSKLEENKISTYWNDYKPEVNEDPKDEVEEPADEEIKKDEVAAGDTITDENFVGFEETDEVKNTWVAGTVKAETYYNGEKNVEMDVDAVKVDDKSVVINAPIDLGNEPHHGVVRIQTDIEIAQGQKYDFSCNVAGATATRAEAVPKIAIRLSSDAENANPSLANKTEAGDVHYISNSTLTPGKLMMEVYYGGNAGQTITVDNIKFMAHPTPTAIETIGEDANAPVEYYNLQGVKVANPEKGIYIRVQGKKVDKVSIR